MTRATGKHIHRKDEFLLAALELFYTKGYENTTIRDIIGELGVSSGAFYHYFQSKEDVVIALAQSYAAEAAKIIAEISERSDLSAVGKMNAIFESINEYKIRERFSHSKFKASLESDANLRLRHKIVHFMKQDVLELYQALIDKGYEEGSLGDPVDSRAMAEFFLDTILALNYTVHELEKRVEQDERDEMEVINQQIFEILADKVLFYETILERAFQVPKGSFDLQTRYCNRVRSKI